MTRHAQTDVGGPHASLSKASWSVRMEVLGSGCAGGPLARSCVNLFLHHLEAIRLSGQSPGYAQAFQDTKQRYQKYL